MPSLFHAVRLFVLVATSVATATAAPAGRHALPDGRVFVGQRKGYVVAQANSTTSQAASSRILYLNRCQGGCTVYPGNENSSSNTSWIPEQTSTLSAFPYGNTKWDAVVACTQEIFAPFNMTITDVDPGQTEHMEAMVAGYASELGFSDQILGIAPAREDCGYIPRSISYTFANNNYYASGGGDVDEICATIGQEAAHTWGLDHELLASDPMTYLPFSGRRHFQNQAAQCGEDQPRTCQCGGSTQNSVLEIGAVFGASDPTPPIVTITSPTDGEEVEPGFPVRATVADANGVARAELYIDNSLVQSLTSLPFAFNAPVSLAEGSHTVTVRAYDVLLASGEASLDVVVGGPCDADDQCESGEICYRGNCVTGPGGEGGLGAACTSASDCDSNNCANDGVDAYCVEACDLSASECPARFDCLPAGDAGVCWPGAEITEPGGCCQSGSPASLAWALGAAVLLRRRRRAA